MTFVAGHFGEWLQGRVGPQGPVALVTLASPQLGVTVTQSAEGPLQLAGCPSVITLQQAQHLLAEIGAPLRGGFCITPDLPPGGGAGMSTAALVALARAAGVDDAARIARACLAVEGASDPLMWPAPDQLLWASRQAKVLRDLDPVPRCEILGGFWGPPQRTDPQDHSFADISDLIEAWSGADLATRAGLASSSAQRCSVLRGPADDPTSAMAGKLGALGFARAHTGPARALIFAPGTVPMGADSQMRAAGLTGVMRFATGGGP